MTMVALIGSALSMIDNTMPMMPASGTSKPIGPSCFRYSSLTLFFGTVKFDEVLKCKSLLELYSVHPHIHTLIVNMKVLYYIYRDI